MMMWPLCLAVILAWQGESVGQQDSANRAAHAIDEGKVEEAIADGRYAEALNLLKGVEAGTSTDLFLLRWKAFCLIATERYEEALMVADRILELDAADSYASFYRAQALAGLEKMDEAVQRLS